MLDLPVGGKAHVMGSAPIRPEAPQTQFTVRIENISPAFPFIASGGLCRTIRRRWAWSTIAGQFLWILV